MNEQDKIYAKVFKVVNKEGAFTKEDFNVFEENFELVRFFFYTELNDRDCFDSLYELICEVKRAAWASGLKANNLKIKCETRRTESGTTINGVCVEKTVQDSILLTNNGDEDEFNMIVFLKPGKNFEEERNFVVTKIEAFEDFRILKKDERGVIIVDDDIKDVEDLKYEYISGKEQIICAV